MCAVTFLLTVSTNKSNTSHRTILLESTQLKLMGTFMGFLTIIHWFILQFTWWWQRRSLRFFLTCIKPCYFVCFDSYFIITDKSNTGKLYHYCYHCQHYHLANLNFLRDVLMVRALELNRFMDWTNMTNYASSKFSYTTLLFSPT